MNRILCIILLCVMLFSCTVYAEGTDTKVPVPIDIATGTRPTSTYNMDESVIPFVKASWGMSVDEVLAITNGQANDEKSEVRQNIVLSDINGEQTIAYHFQDDGLYRVSMTILHNAEANNPALQDSFEKLYSIAKQYTTIDDGNNPDVCLLIQNKSNYVYKSPKTDIVFGYFRSAAGTTFDASIIFSKPASFDEIDFRNTNLFSATITAGGQTGYYDAMNRMHSFLTDYSPKNRTTNGCCFSSLIRMIGSELTTINCIPCYKMIFSYSGIVSPQSVNSFIFQIDNTLYQLTPLEGSTSINGFNEYSRQFEFLIDVNNSIFMEALSTTQNTVRVEIKGDGFVLSFDMPSKSKKMLVEDWSMYNKAGGTADVFLMHNGSKMKVR